MNLTSERILLSVHVVSLVHTERIVFAFHSGLGGVPTIRVTPGSLTTLDDLPLRYCSNFLINDVKVVLGLFDSLSISLSWFLFTSNASHSCDGHLRSTCGIFVKSHPFVT